LGRMRATLAALTLLRVLSEGPASKSVLLERLGEELGVERNERSLRRYLEALREAGFEVERNGDKYELRRSPVRLDFTDYETLATLSVVESLAERQPVYGEHLRSAAGKLREALPPEGVKFADSGRIEFEVASASDPPEDPAILDVLRHATHHRQQVAILYRSIESRTRCWRTVEPVRVYYAQKAHRLDAYEPQEDQFKEFRVNRVEDANMLPQKFSPEAHRVRFDPVEVRLSDRAFEAYGKTIIPDESAGIEKLEDGGAIVSGRTPSTFWTVREIAALGPEAEVLGDERFKRAFLDFLNATLEKYS
jgi:predicted DNA-binding transcriptional regulator YafY